MEKKMEYKLNFKISVKDYRAFNFDFLFRRKVFYIVIFIPLFLILSSEILTFKTFARFITNIMPFFILIVLYILYFTIYLSRVYKSDNLLHEDQELTLTETGIEEKTSRSFCNYYLDDLKKVIIGKKVISIYIAVGRAIVIPRSCFSSKEEEKEVEEFIKANYRKKK